MSTVGKCLFRKPVNVSSGSGSVHVEPGEKLYLLTYRGEGFTRAWFKGKFYEELDGSRAFFNDICATDPNRCAGAIVEQPNQVWWVQIKNAKGQIGWTNKQDKFDRKDGSEIDSRLLPSPILRPLHPKPGPRRRSGQT